MTTAVRLRKRNEWDAFLQDLHDVFPTTEFRVEFIEETDEHIDVRVRTNGEWVVVSVNFCNLVGR